MKFNGKIFLTEWSSFLRDEACWGVKVKEKWQKRKWIKTEEQNI